MKLPDVENIQHARQRLDNALHITPVVSSTTLDKIFGLQIVLKAENLQITGSFKPRGALNTLLCLPEDQREKGVIAVSAGNHGAAVAWAARKTSIKATVVMPVSASRNKIAAVKAYGAQLKLAGASMIEAFVEMEKLRQENGLTLIHPFENSDIISGAGTLGLELLDQISDLDNVLVPVGGGGLISGIAIAIKALSPKTKVFGIEPEGANAMYKSLEAGHPVKLDSVNTIADGLAAPYAGELTYAAVSKFVDDVVCVSDDDIRVAMKFLLERCKLLVEPGGAVGLAALLSKKLICKPNSKTAIVLSGGNVDLSLICSLQDVPNID